MYITMYIYIYTDIYNRLVINTGLHHRWMGHVLLPCSKVTHRKISVACFAAPCQPATTFEVKDA